MKSPFSCILAIRNRVPLATSRGILDARSPLASPLGRRLATASVRDAARTLTPTQWLGYTRPNQPLQVNKPLI
ncbi:hypothetical protein [aff. Roholtiella sp. LEGE 12411]|uniref:hypothetical protein n=1 Tax=aff. Roholtiella sp. LEGE 12411 TaxID=1828822 RepID=UPI00187F0F5D|nr:hypothetical protein [aff. Roholtiella sp. LEGE 12411]MBE9034920.1 hypothetical protein [aff. Roholtiella sp. LEGE 12411]